MPNYRCTWVPGDTYFFTVNLPERRRTLLINPASSLQTSLGW